ncbi:MAG: DUF1499 domain-containing protein [Hyphomonadaceae bacterium]|nr:DUF1499 domain-containing protein [Hyphomonadaceae bacterium]
MASTVQSAGWRGKLAGIALGWSLFSVAWFAMAALGSRIGLWDWRFGLGQMQGNVGAGLGRWILLISAILAVAGLIAALLKSPRTRPTMLAIAAIMITLMAGGRWFGFQLTALSLPPLHEAATDWDDPVPFSSNLQEKRAIGQCDKDGDGAVSEEERTGCGLNPFEMSPTVTLPDWAQERWPGFHGKTVAQVQTDFEMDPALKGEDAEEKAYPPMNTAITTLSQNDAFEVTIDLVSKHGWKIVGANHEAGRIEATATSTWYGFKDDVAFRVRALETGGSEVDMRSVSRVGLSDLGANARRVSNFMYDLERALDEAES